MGIVLQSIHLGVDVMIFEIREFNLEDSLAIYHLNKEEMGYDYPLEDTFVKLMHLKESHRDKIYVAVVSGEVVGYIHACDYDLIYEDHMKNVMGIAVKSEYKKQGIGKALLETVEQWAKESGANAVRLVSGSHRKEAHEFYRHCGYGNEKNQVNFKKNVEE